MAKLVSATYGDALFELALEEEKIDAFKDEVEALLNVLAENDDLIKLLNHPKISKEDKIQVVSDVFGGKISKELEGLINMIVQKNRTADLVEVFKFFVDKVKEFKNIGTAYVATAVELTDAQKSAVKAKLLETTKYVEIEINYAVDKDLIGGMVIRIGDRVVDSSIKTKLYELTKDLTKIQLVSQ